MEITLKNYKDKLGVLINTKELKVDWENISYCQKLSEDFIREFKDKIIDYNIFNIVHNCGNPNRNIFILKDDPKIIYIGCFKGTKEKAIKEVKKKYKGKKIKKERKEYIKKIKECFKGD